MTWKVDMPVRVGPLAFAAITETKLSVRLGGFALAAIGEKRPVLVLQIEADTVTAVDIKGQVYQAEEIEYLYPKAISWVRSQLHQSK